MANTRKLLSALESIANEQDPKGVLQAFEVLRTELGSDAPGTRPADHQISKKYIQSIQDDARRLLKRAAKLADKGEQKTEISRLAVMYMGQYDDEAITGKKADRNLAYQFAVRAVWKRGKDPAMELVGPVDANPEFLIGFACWLVAKSEPAFVWLRTKRKQCGNKDCPKLFSDISRGRPKKYCSNQCYQTMHRQKDTRLKANQ